MADSTHASDYGPAMGRYIEHPPEPPHLIQVLYKLEQKQLIADYQAVNPDAKAPKAVEHWLELDAEGNWVQKPGEKPTVAQVLHAGTLKEPLPLVGYAPWENHVFFLVALIFVVALFGWLTAPFRSNRRGAMRNPCRRQAFVEMIVGGFDDFCRGILGPQNGRLYMPYIATLFTVILTCNLMGLIPLLRAPTASLVITFSLALCTFFVVQGTAWIRLGPTTYLHHLMGSPKDAIGWVLSPLFLVLELISDFVAKPLSLALRLFGNIFGKDILLGAFLGMGVTLAAALVGSTADTYMGVGVPLTVPFYFLGLLLSTIQALVFSLLTCIYITMVLPHDHHHDDHGPGDEAHGHDAHHHGHQAVNERVPA